MLATAPIRRSSPRAVLVTVERQAIVGRRIDYQIAIGDALDSLGAAIQYLAAVVCPEDRVPVSEAVRLLREERTTLGNTLAIMRAECGELDGLCEDADRHPNHGAAA